MTRPLTKRQSEILSLIRDHVARLGYAPTMQELGAMLGGLTRVTIHGHIKALVAQGHLIHAPRKSRALTLPTCCPTCGKTTGESNDC